MKKQQRKPQPEKRSRKSIILISLAVVLTACCGLSALASLLGGGDTARTEPTPVVETALQLEKQVQEVSAPPEAPASTDTPPIPTATPAPADTPTTAPTAAPTPAPSPTPVPSTPAPAQPSANVPAGAIAAQLARVVDGDTIDVVIDGQPATVRYIGIDTPEQGDLGYRAATDANAALLGAGTLYLVADTSDKDRYDRLLRYVYTEDGAMVNREMVAQGWAQPVEYPPDTRFATEFRQAASEAAQAGVGFWSGSASDGVMPYALTTGNSTNIRSGPGTVFDISTAVPLGTPLTVYGRTPDGEWLQVRTPDRSGGWISAGLVALAVAASRVEVAQDIPAPPVVTQVDTTRSGAVQVPVAPAGPAPAGGAVRIVQLSPEGDDEYVVIQNTGADPVDLSGWSIQSYGASSCAPQADQVFTFPGGFQLAAGASVRVHSGPSAFGNPPGDLLWTTKNIWNNAGDRADLRDAGGQVVSASAYGSCR